MKSNSKAPEAASTGFIIPWQLRYVPIADLDFSCRIYNVLMNHGYKSVEQVLTLSEKLSTSKPTTLYALRKELHTIGISQIYEKCKMVRDGLLDPSPLYPKNIDDIPMKDLLQIPEIRPQLAEFVKEHDVTLQDLGLSSRTCRVLQMHGIHSISEVLSVSDSEFRSFPKFGEASAAEVYRAILNHLTEHQRQLYAFFGIEEPEPQESDEAEPDSDKSPEPDAVMNVNSPADPPSGLRELMKSPEALAISAALNDTDRISFYQIVMKAYVFGMENAKLIKK